MFGIDLVNVKRIEKLIDRRGLEVVQKFLATDEKTPQSIAGVFAAKEALGKAVGKGINKFLLSNSQIQKNEYGKPIILYNNRVYDLSITHTNEFALALVCEGKFIVSSKDMMESLPKRSPEGHKGSFGKLAIIGGSKQYTGSVYLSAQAAFRAGVGYVYLFVPQEIRQILQIKTTEAIVHDFNDWTKIDKKFNAILIGPGLESNISFIEEVVEYAAENDIITIIDAGGFSYIKKSETIFNEGKLILTPHIAEAAFLLDKDKHEVMSDKTEAVKELSRKYGATVVLKCHRSLVYGNGQLYINHTGNDGMGTAGSGDVLAGVISSFAAQGLDSFSATKLGTYFHGLSGDYMANKYNRRALIASDLIDGLKYVLKEDLC